MGSGLCTGSRLGGLIGINILHPFYPQFTQLKSNTYSSLQNNWGRRFRKRSSSTMRFLRRTATNPCSPLTLVHLAPTVVVLDEFLSQVGLDSSKEGQEPPLIPANEDSAIQQFQEFLVDQDLTHPDIQCVGQIQTAGLFQHVFFPIPTGWSRIFLSHGSQDGGQTPRQQPLWSGRSSCLICYTVTPHLSDPSCLVHLHQPHSSSRFRANFKTEAPLIVDAGANVGLFALWARERWTKCQL